MRGKGLGVPRLGRLWGLTPSPLVAGMLQARPGGGVAGFLGAGACICTRGGFRGVYGAFTGFLRRQAAGVRVVGAWRVTGAGLCAPWRGCGGCVGVNGAGRVWGGFWGRLTIVSSACFGYEKTPPPLRGDGASSCRVSGGDAPRLRPCCGGLRGMLGISAKCHRPAGRVRLPQVHGHGSNR